MTYIVDTHILVWFLDNNKRLKHLDNEPKDLLPLFDSSLDRLDTSPL